MATIDAFVSARMPLRWAVYWFYWSERVAESVWFRPLSHVWCGWRHGHAFQLDLSAGHLTGRIGLRCHECGYQSPGVEWFVRRARVLRFGA